MLWRRDRLSSVVELDGELVIRKASPLLGLITGVPTTSMLRKPLSRCVMDGRVAWLADGICFVGLIALCATKGPGGIVLASTVARRLEVEG